MSFLIISLFALTALIGMFLLSYVLIGKNTPKGVAIIHGFFGAVGIMLLLILSFSHHILFASLIIFILAAFGGLYLFSLDMSGKKIPKIFAIGHGLTAITGFIVLLVLIFYYL